MDTHNYLKKSNIVIYILTSAVFMFIFCKFLNFSINIINSSIHVNAFNEVRDYASFRLTHLIMQGQNPYKIDILYDNTVPFLYLYTPLMPFLVAILCRITGLSIIAGYYFINIMLLLLTALNIILILKSKLGKNKYIFILLSMFITFAVATLFSLFGMPIFNFRTGPIAIYIMSLILLIINKNYKQTTLVSLLSILLVFTMQVMFIETISIIVFYFIIDKKVLLQYIIKMIIIGILTIICVNLFFPLYWFETIYAMFFTNQNYGTIMDSVLNIGKFFNRYLTLVFMVFLGGLYISLKDKNTILSNRLITYVTNDHFVLLVFINLIVSIFASLYFAKGGHDGFKYCQALIGINIFVLAVYLVTEFLSINVASLLISIILAFSSVCIISNFNFYNYKTENIDEYNRLFSDLSQYNIDDVYFSVNATPYLMNLDSWEDYDVTFNDGHIQYFNKTFPRIPLISDLFAISEVEDSVSNYVNMCNERIRNKSYELVTICIDNLIDNNLLNEYYNKKDEYFIKSDTNGFSIATYVPKE